MMDFSTKDAVATMKQTTMTDYQLFMNTQKLMARLLTKYPQSLSIQLKLFPGATVPGRHGAYIDLCANADVELSPGDYAEIPLGVAMKLPAGYHAQLLPRSSSFKKYSFIVVNSMGIIDNGYCGDDDEWKLAVFHPHGREKTVVHKGDRICQFCLVKDMPEVTFTLKEHLDDPSRGGFGSTGEK